MLSKIVSAQPEPIFITSFTHKGGVGKTTGLHNIACVLAKEFKLRVLLIDCDPQCSLTSVILHDFFVKIGKNYNKKHKANLTESQLKQLGEEIFYEKIKVEAEAPRSDALKTRSHNREVNENPTTKRRTVYECFKHEDLAYFAEEEIIKKTVRDEVELVHLSQYGGLYVLPGDLLLNSLERDVSGGFSFGKIEGLERQKRIPGAIPQMFREIARQNNIDLILVDLSPAATFFNQSIVMNSDYFIISNLADYYSRRSITSIADVLKAWNRDVGFLRELKSSSAYFRFPACPKFLGHIFHRVKVHEGQATLDKQDKIDLIQQEIRRRFIDENLLGTDKDTIVVDKFKLLEPPIIKEFDRFYDQAVEKGIPMPYITGDNIKWEDGKQSPAGKKAVGNTQQFFMNSYFTAVSIIFSNLSDEHHLRLRNMFKPVQPAAPEPEEIRQDQYEFVGNYGGERLCFSMRRVDDAYRVFVPELRHMFGILRDLIKDKRKDIVNLFFEEILNGFLPDGKWNNYVRDNKFNSLAQKLNNESEAKEESKQDVLIEMSEENPTLENLNELQLLAQIHLDRRQIVQNYIGNCLEEKKTMAVLTKYIQSEEAKEAYVRHAIDGRVRLGAKAFSLCALAKEKNLRIWEPTYFPQIILKEVQLAGDDADDFIDLIEVERNVFRKLIRKNSTIKDPFEANGLIGKRQNQHEYDGPELDKKVKKR